MIFTQDNARQLLKSDNKQLESIHSLESCLDLAYEAFDSGDYESAICHIIMAIELSPEDSRPIRELAKLHVVTKQWNEAVKCLDYLLLLDPQDDDAKSAKEQLEARIYYYSMVKQFPLYS